MKRWVAGLALSIFVCAASDAAASCMTFRWTATGDDGHIGTATYYDIRYSRSGITEANFYSAQQVIFPPIPRESGSPEQWTICGLPSLTGYNVAIKAGDEAGNWSPVSNVAFFVTDEQVGFRGDVNGNGIHYEVGDVLLFTNYFLFGSTVFTVNIVQQIEATDVNADGITLTVADLTYLIRVVVGDASPLLNRLNPHAQQVSVETRRDGRSVVISTDAVATIGTALFVCEVDADAEIGIPRLKPAAAGMDLTWHRDGNQLRLLVYDLGHARVESGRHDLIEIPLSGSGMLRILSSDIADFESRAYRSGSVEELPSQFTLDQNYPNPFNPSTTISYALPSPALVSVDVFNVLGQKVRTLVDETQEAGRHEVVWDGTDAAGITVSSGVYFYRVTADDITRSRKMLLLK
ncbi:MAG: FlgD immunoglobulin-like domain containing protein [candidate division Zixibacteria bacterium]|jgi:hypothetical protein|nr:FlgD immunoglobulin-like domain containing protein [candidate division Zixibacteria bacterium]